MRIMKTLGYSVLIFKSIPKEIHALKLLIREIHGGSVVGHYGESKTLTMLRGYKFWLGISKDVQDILRRCATFQVANSLMYSTDDLLTLNTKSKQF